MSANPRPVRVASLSGQAPSAAPSHMHAIADRLAGRSQMYGGRLYGARDGGPVEADEAITAAEAARALQEERGRWDRLWSRARYGHQHLVLDPDTGETINYLRSSW